MTLFELGILLTTAGISGAGCAALCGVVLERIGRTADTLRACPPRAGAPRRSSSPPFSA